MKILVRVIILILFSLPLIGNSQNCDNFFETSCILPSNWDYEINSQSMNIPMYSGQSFKYSAVFYEGLEYSICFCAEEGLGNIRYRLLSTDVYLDQIFNSDFDSNMAHMEFINKNTRIILVEVQVLREQGKRIDPTDKKCLGIIIGQKKIEDEW